MCDITYHEFIPIYHYHLIIYNSNSLSNSDVIRFIMLKDLSIILKIRSGPY